MSTYGVLGGSLGVLDGGGDNGLGSLWAKSVGENLITGGWLWGVVRSTLNWSWLGIN